MYTHTVALYPNPITSHDVELLLCRIQSRDALKRIQAREVLGKIGKSIVPAVLKLLWNENEIVRWEACKILGKIKDARSGNLLAEMLLDENMDVRWVAAEALIALEYDAIEPLLECIEQHFESTVVRESAHHILKALKDQDIFLPELENVLDSLKQIVPPIRLAVAANTALQFVRSRKLQIQQ